MTQSEAIARYYKKRDSRPPMLVSADGTIVELWAVRSGDTIKFILRPIQ